MYNRTSTYNRNLRVIHHQLNKEWELKKETKVILRFLMVKHSEIIWFLHLHIH